MRKVSLEVTVDRWVSDALGKIRSKKSVSNFVNGILGTMIKQYDPGPSSPFVYELVKVMEKYRKEAEASGDSRMLASIAQLHSAVEAYIDLAEAEQIQQRNGPPEPGPEGERKMAGRNDSTGGGGMESYLAMPPVPVRTKKDYYWYAVPILCHEKPMVYLRDAKVWKCLICGRLIHET